MEVPPQKHEVKLPSHCRAALKTARERGAQTTS